MKHTVGHRGVRFVVSLHTNFGDQNGKNNTAGHHGQASDILYREERAVLAVQVVEIY